jgi:hypothetical protein
MRAGMSESNAEAHFNHARFKKRAVYTDGSLVRGRGFET